VNSNERDDYQAAGERMYQDANALYDNARYGTATHLFGLAAECAIKSSLQRQPGTTTALPYKHIPELIDDAKRLMSGRRRSYLVSLISHPDYMAGWKVVNRYWSDELFNIAQCRKYRDDANKTIQAMYTSV